MSLHRHGVMSPKEFPSQSQIQKTFLLAEMRASHLSISPQPEGRTRAGEKKKVSLSHTHMRHVNR